MVWTHPAGSAASGMDTRTQGHGVSSRPDACDERSILSSSTWICLLFHKLYKKSTCGGGSPHSEGSGTDAPEWIPLGQLEDALLPGPVWAEHTPITLQRKSVACEPKGFPVI